MRTAPRVLTIALAVVMSESGLAQAPSWELSPALLRSEDDRVGVGVRWAAGFQRTPQVHLVANFPRETWAELQAAGTLAWKKEATSEPLADVEGLAGLRVVLLKQRPCTPDCPDPDLDLGYLVIAGQVDGEAGPGGDEIQGSAGGSLLYRHFHQHALWPFVPSIGVAYQISVPVRSELRDALNEESSSHRQLDLEGIWSLRLDRRWLPAFVRPGRIDVNARYFRKYGLASAVEAVTDDDGTFAAASAGYELTGRVPWVRQIFLRYSDGEQPTSVEPRRAWMLGFVLGEGR